jgi:hypothetical protein
MCYSVYISTDSPEDLRNYNSEFVKFEKLTDANTDPCTGLLEFAHRWYIGSLSGCSCTFRHLVSIELGFSDPVDWYEEDKEVLEATQELYATLNQLLSSGSYVDLLDLWHGVKPEEIMTLEVSLDDVSSTAFRLFENHKFRLMKKT